VADHGDFSDEFSGLFFDCMAAFVPHRAFFDAFTRAFGVPVIGVLGFMTVTHGYKPSIRQDVALFALAFGAAFALEAVDFIAPALPYFYVVMWTWLSIYVAYFVKRLLDAGEKFHAMTTTVAMVTSQVIACMYDFYEIPGDEHNVVFNFYFMALLTWAYFIAATSSAYCALERERGGSRLLSRTAPC